MAQLKKIYTCHETEATNCWGEMTSFVACAYVFRRHHLTIIADKMLNITQQKFEAAQN